jgi:glycosyltransferase involved in cell wall biosynthesis
MAMGRPIVSSPVGEMTGLFRSEPIGRLAPDTPDKFAEAAWELLQNPEVCTKMGEAGREAAEKRYSWEFLTRRLEAFYHEIVAQQS